MDKDEATKIKKAIMEIYECRESNGLDILCKLVGWMPNSRNAQPKDSADNGS